MEIFVWSVLRTYLPFASSKLGKRTSQALQLAERLGFGRRFVFPVL